jgi:hypothetical protein
MNIVLQLQKLDDLIVEKTRPPVTAVLRNKLNPVLEQAEALLEGDKAHAKLKKAHKRVVFENQKLKKALAKKLLKPFQPPKGGMFEAWTQQPDAEPPMEA